jgi:hypothetical protein
MAHQTGVLIMSKFQREYLNAQANAHAAEHGHLVNPRYHAGAVQNAIDSSNRHGQKIGKREAALIHRLLAGR